MRLFWRRSEIRDFLIVIITLVVGLIVTTVSLCLNFNSLSIYDGNSIFSLFFKLGTLTLKNFVFYGVIVISIFYIIGLLVSIAGGVIVFINSKKILLQVGIILLIISNLAVIIFYALSANYTIAMCVTSSVALLVLAVSLVFSFLFMKKSESEVELEKMLKEKEFKPRKVLELNKWRVLAINILGLICFFLPIVVPFLYNDVANIYFVKVQENNFNYLGLIITLIVFVIALIGYARSIAYFVNAPKTFFRKTKVLNFMALIYNALLFIIAIVLIYVNGLKGFISSNPLKTLTYIPLIISLVMYVFVCLIDEKMDDYENKLEDKKYNKKSYITFAIPFIFICLLTLITFLSLAVEFIDVILKTDETVIQESKLTGYELVTQYKTLGKGFQFVALLEIIILMCSGTAFIISLFGFISKSKNYGTIIKISAYTNVFLIFMCGISSLYFKVGSKINIDNLNSLFSQYSSIIDVSSYDLEIKTQTLYLFLVELIVLALMMVTKQMKNDEDFVAAEKLEVKAEILNELEKANSGAVSNSNEASQAISQSSDKSSGSNESKNKEVANEEESNNLKDYNMCPSFHELDLKEKEFIELLEERKKEPLEVKSLSSLCDYIVEYARNSRLHLSYTKEDIATFVSGLGTSKLTILQGMSGTGKTSLPKIFAEAINSNVEIIEIESSWRDKNELLGHFNEFTQKYTPKKFTEALYKARMNEKVITFIVLDELNLSRIEYYFSDFLSLMENEKDKRYIKLTNTPIDYVENGEHQKFRMLVDGESMKVSDNIWFIGTANMDESTFAISDKVYDRAQTMTFSKRAKKVEVFKDEMTPKFLSYDAFESLLDEAINSKEIENLENNLIVKKVEEILRPYNISFGNRILNQMETFIKIYTKCIDSKDSFNEALEIILLSKVVRKLETKTIEDRESLIEEFEKLGLFRCKEFLVTLNEE